MNASSARLRRMLEEPGIVAAPGVYDGLSAQLAEEEGSDGEAAVSFSGGDVQGWSQATRTAALMNSPAARR